MSRSKVPVSARILSAFLILSIGGNAPISRGSEPLFISVHPELNRGTLRPQPARSGLEEELDPDHPGFVEEQQVGELHAGTLDDGRPIVLKPGARKSAVLWKSEVFVGGEKWGFFNVGRTENRWFLLSLEISPKGQRVGSKVVEAILQEGIRRGIRYFQTRVTNPRLMRIFYRNRHYFQNPTVTVKTAGWFWPASSTPVALKRFYTRFWIANTWLRPERYASVNWLLQAELIDPASNSVPDRSGVEESDQRKRDRWEEGKMSGEKKKRVEISGRGESGAVGAGLSSPGNPISALPRSESSSPDSQTRFRSFLPLHGVLTQPESQPQENGVQNNPNDKHPASERLLSDKGAEDQPSQRDSSRVGQESNQRGPLARGQSPLLQVYQSSPVPSNQPVAHDTRQKYTISISAAQQISSPTRSGLEESLTSGDSETDGVVQRVLEGVDILDIDFDQLQILLRQLQERNQRLILHLQPAGRAAVSEFGEYGFDWQSDLDHTMSRLKEAVWPPQAEIFSSVPGVQLSRAILFRVPGGDSVRLIAGTGSDLAHAGLPERFFQDLQGLQRPRNHRQGVAVTREEFFRQIRQFLKDGRLWVAGQPLVLRTPAARDQFLQQIGELGVNWPKGILLSEVEWQEHQKASRQAHLRGLKETILGELTPRADRIRSRLMSRMERRIGPKRDFNTDASEGIQTAIGALRPNRFLPDRLEPGSDPAQVLKSARSALAREAALLHRRIVDLPMYGEVLAQHLDRMDGIFERRDEKALVDENRLLAEEAGTLFRDHDPQQMPVTLDRLRQSVEQADRFLHEGNLKIPSPFQDPLRVWQAHAMAILAGAHRLSQPIADRFFGDPASYVGTAALDLTLRVTSLAQISRRGPGEKLIGVMGIVFLLEEKSYDQDSFQTNRKMVWESMVDWSKDVIAQAARTNSGDLPSSEEISDTLSAVLSQLGSPPPALVKDLFIGRPAAQWTASAVFANTLSAAAAELGWQSVAAQHREDALGYEAIARRLDPIAKIWNPSPDPVTTALRRRIRQLGRLQESTADAFGTLRRTADAHRALQAAPESTPSDRAVAEAAFQGALRPAGEVGSRIERYRQIFDQVEMYTILQMDNSSLAGLQQQRKQDLEELRRGRTEWLRAEDHLQAAVQDYEAEFPKLPARSGLEESTPYPLPVEGLGDFKHESYLNRHRPQWRWLRENALSQLLQSAMQKEQQRGQRRLHILIFGASTGEELARVFHEIVTWLEERGHEVAADPADKTRWQIYVSGIDLDEEIVARGRDRIQGKSPFFWTEEPDWFSPRSYDYAKDVIETLNRHRTIVRENIQLYSDDLRSRWVQSTFSDVDLVLWNSTLYQLRGQGEETAPILQYIDETWPQAWMATDEGPLPGMTAHHTFIDWSFSSDPLQGVIPSYSFGIPKYSAAGPEEVEAAAGRLEAALQALFSHPAGVTHHWQVLGPSILRRYPFLAAMELSGYFVLDPGGEGTDAVTRKLAEQPNVRRDGLVHYYGEADEVENFTQYSTRHGITFMPNPRVLPNLPPRGLLRQILSNLTDLTGYVVEQRLMDNTSRGRITLEQLVQDLVTLSGA